MACGSLAWSLFATPPTSVARLSPVFVRFHSDKKPVKAAVRQYFVSSTIGSNFYHPWLSEQPGHVVTKLVRELSAGPVYPGSAIVSADPLVSKIFIRHRTSVNRPI